MTGVWTLYFQLFNEIITQLVAGGLVTLEVTVLSLILGIAVGLVLMLGVISKRPALRIPARVYVEVVRGIPALVILYIIYFGLPDFGVKLNPVTSAVLGLGLNGGAYLAELFRSTVEAVPAGQIEAALAVGLSPSQTMREITLPQAAVVAIPNVGNFGIGLLKDTAIVSTIAVPEIILTANNLISQTFVAMPIYLTAAALYLIMSYPLSLLVRSLERRMAQGARGQASQAEPVVTTAA